MYNVQIYIYICIYCILCVCSSVKEKKCWIRQIQGSGPTAPTWTWSASDMRRYSASLPASADHLLQTACWRSLKLKTLGHWEMFVFNLPIYQYSFICFTVGQNQILLPPQSLIVGHPDPLRMFIAFTSCPSSSVLQVLQVLQVLHSNRPCLWRPSSPGATVASPGANPAAPQRRTRWTLRHWLRWLRDRRGWAENPRCRAGWRPTP